MQTSFWKKTLAAALGALALLNPLAFGQGITTSGLNGVVRSADGNPVPGANVVALHEPSGTRAVTVARAGGQFNLSGLRPGGPYTVTVEAEGFRGESRSNVFLELGQSTGLSFSLSSDVVTLQEFNIEATRDLIFGVGKTGSSTDLSSEDIENSPSVRRNVQDIARLDSRLYLGSLDQGGQLSAQGQNFRYNSLLIDGVQANDSFGLNSNGFSSLRSPIPLEALQAFSVETNPYDVRRAGFTGALLNAVTKSGTNRYSGSVYYELTRQNMRASDPRTGIKDPFEERTWGATFGGPLLKDRVFFFVSYDDFLRETLPPNQNFVPASADEQAVRARASALGYDVGNFSASSTEEQVNWIGKVDWNISNAHRLSVTYRKNDGTSPVFASFSNSTQTSFSAYWYDQPRVTESYVAQLNSTWTPDFRTEFSFSVADYDGSPANRGPAFPEVTINGVSGVRRDTGASITTGSLRLGTEFSRQLNEITTKTTTLAGFAEYSRGDHVFLAGFDYEGREVTNKFVQAFLGSYTFTSVANWQAGTASSLQRAILAPGATVDDAIARFDIAVFGLFLQDTWRFNDRLTLMGGLRFDQQWMPDAPKDIPNAGTYSEALFRQRFGRSSTTNPDGEYAIAPRFGFTYEVSKEKRRQLRGGFGLFQGRNPLVWLSNAYSNRGVVARQSQSNVTFNPNVTPGTGVGGIPVINVTDENFKQPLVYKGNLAYDHGLPWDNWVAGVELGGTLTYKMPFTTNLNLRPVGFMPDGRIRYAGNIVNTSSGASRSSASAAYGNASLYQNPEFADVYLLRNSGEGGGYDLSLRLNRPWKKNWTASFSWTFSDYTETGPMTSSVAQSNYNNRTVFNPNENKGSTSNTNIDHKFVASYTRRFEFIKKAPTTLTVVYEARTGRPYSWVFSGDANGDGFTDNDLFYVPTGPTDPKVRFTDAAQQTAFYAFVDSSNLAKYKGQVVPRNTERSPWNQTVDLKFTQVIPLYKNLRTEAFVNVINFANLLNNEWGILDEVPFSFRRSVAGATYDAAANGGQGQYVYRFDAATLDGIPTVVDATPASRWQVQVGMRLKF